MKSLVVGFGSIGSRHARNLRILGVDRVAVVEPHPARAAEARTLGYGPVFPDLRKATETGSWDIALVCTPSHRHAEDACILLSCCKGVFIEKPLATTRDALETLRTSSDRSRALTMVACNMRFHPCLTDLRRILAEGQIGRPVSALIRFGYFLPSWRPGRDYRSMYSARRDWGGGIILDDIHEIDLAWKVLGPPQGGWQVVGGASGALEGDVEDHAFVLWRTPNDVTVCVVMDYLSPVYRREFEIIGSKGAVLWNEAAGTLQICHHAHPRWEVVRSLGQFDVNSLYLSELEHFLHCIRTGTMPENSVSEAIPVTRLALEARERIYNAASKEERCQAP